VQRADRSRQQILTRGSSSKLYVVPSKPFLPSLSPNLFPQRQRACSSQHRDYSPSGRVAAKVRFAWKMLAKATVLGIPAAGTLPDWADAFLFSLQVVRLSLSFNAADAILLISNAVRTVDTARRRIHNLHDEQKSLASLHKRVPPCEWALRPHMMRQRMNGFPGFREGSERYASIWCADGCPEDQAGPMRTFRLERNAASQNCVAE